MDSSQERWQDATFAFCQRPGVNCSNCRVSAMYRSAAATPPVAYSSARSPTTGDDQLQIFGRLDCGYEEVIIVRIDFDREGECALAAPVSAVLQVPHFA